MEDQNIIAGLDVGTTKVCFVIAEQVGAEELNILGMGTTPSFGLRKGAVVNIDSTTEAVVQSAEDAQLIAGQEPVNLFSAITGPHIKGQNTRGIVAVSSKNKEITENEVERVIEAAQAIHIPSDKEIIHIIPWEFIVDEQDGIIDPYGMTGVRLEVDAHLVTGSITAIQNVTKCVNRAGFNVQDFVLNSLASAEACLSEDEKEVGVLLMDIGGGTTDVILFVNGSIRYSAVFPIGGKHVTRDISLGLRIPDNIAERTKLDFGCTSLKLPNTDANIEIPGIGGRNSKLVPHSILCDIIEPRMEEIFDIVYRDIVKENLLGLASGGLVITGGASLLPGADEVAEKIFNLPVRIGSPQNVGGLVDKISSPIYSTAVGLVLYGLREQNVGYYENQQSKISIFKRMKHSITDFAKEFFA